MWTSRTLCFATQSNGALWTLTITLLCIWDNLNLLPICMYLIFLILRVNLLAVRHRWIKFIAQFILCSRIHIWIFRGWGKSIICIHFGLREQMRCRKIVNVNRKQQRSEDRALHNTTCHVTEIRLSSINKGLLLSVRQVGPKRFKRKAIHPIEFQLS